MSGVSVYLLSIVGVTLLSVILDLVLPSGQVNKYIKGVMALVVVFVIVSPLPKLINGQIDIKSLWTNSQSTDYSDVINKQTIRTQEKSLENILKQNGFKDVDISIWGDVDSGKLKITYIFVDLSNVVLNEENQRINKYEAIKDLLVKQTGIKEEQVIFNG